MTNTEINQDYALKDLIKKAEKLGADHIVNVRYHLSDASHFNQYGKHTVKHLTRTIVYGDAIKIKK